MQRLLRPIFFASFLFTFHLALLSYLNSTVLGTHGSNLQTAVAYTLASGLSLFLLLIAPVLVSKYGASSFLLMGLASATILLWILGLLTNHSGFTAIFILYFSLNTVIWYAFDLVVEHYSRENTTGNIRGLYLTLNNAGWVIAPMTASAIASFSGFAGTYLVASFVLLVTFLIIASTKQIKKSPHIPKISLRQAFRALMKHHHARRLVTLYFLLQFFFAWMVLYMAPYLLDLGFTWKAIGIIFSSMLLPFVLFQYKTGKIADRLHNERFIIILGFGITTLATLFLAIPFTPSIAAFAAILFVTRVGASIIEVGCESAFFKAVSEHDTALISTLRMTLPLAYIIAPLVGGLILWFGNMQILFIILSMLLLGAMVYALRLKTTQ